MRPLDPQIAPSCNLLNPSFFGCNPDSHIYMHNIVCALYSYHIFVAWYVIMVACAPVRHMDGDIDVAVAIDILI